MEKLAYSKEYLQKFYDIFVGKGTAHGLQLEGGNWTVKKQRITLDLLKQHLEKKITVGFYNIYKKNGYEYCKWICVDIDAHDPDEKRGIDKKINEILAYILSIYNIPNEAILLESSGRGYHIWIFLTPLTTLKRAYILKEDIEARLKKEFKMGCEVFPKQESLKGTKGFGNFVKIPFSINKKNNIESYSVFDFDIMRVQGFNIKKLVSKLRKKERINEKTVVIRKKKRCQSEVDLSKWKPYEKTAEDFFRKLRPCTRAIVKGEKQAIGEYGHYMRMQVANELFQLHAPEEVRILAFQNQDDFDPEKVKYQIKDLEERCRSYQRFFIAQCSSIQKRGYCLPNCYRLGYTKNRKFEEKKRNPRKKGVTGGWEELSKVIRKQIQNEHKIFFEKTTRSGVSWNIIINALQMGKNLLIIGPTIKMAEDMINEAMEETKNRFQMNPLMFRFGSNRELCNVVKKEVLNYSILRNFPFFIKGRCQGCVEDCLMKEARNNIQNYDIIYTTIAKLNAFLKSKDPMSRAIFRKIIDHIDLIFLDEVSHILEPGSEAFEYFSKADLIYNTRVPTIDFYSKFKLQYKMFIDSKLLNSVDIGKQQIENIFKSCYVMVENIEKRLKSAFFPGVDFINMKSNIYRQIKENEKYHKDKKKHYKHYGSGIFDWLNAYKLLIQFSKEKGVYLEALVKILLLGKYESFYIQKTNPIKYDEKIEVYPALKIKEVLDFIGKISNGKIFFCTDATEPPIPPEELFEGIKRVFVNDPNNTAAKSTVYYDKRNRNIIRFEFVKKDVSSFLKKKSDKTTFVISQNMKTANKVRKILNDLKVRYGINTYFRSDNTIGVASPLRKMITIGSPHPPKNCYMWLADIFRKESLSALELEELGKKLEIYNAKSTFFQAISRVKDPYGKIRSEIFCFGLNKKNIKKFLNFDIAIPVIKKMK